jgi:hypothetical protein
MRQRAHQLRRFAGRGVIEQYFGHATRYIEHHKAADRAIRLPQTPRQLGEQRPGDLGLRLYATAEVGTTQDQHGGR